MGRVRKREIVVVGSFYHDCDDAHIRRCQPDVRARSSSFDSSDTQNLQLRRLLCSIDRVAMDK